MSDGLDVESMVGELVISKNESGQIVAVTIQDNESRILKVLAQSEPVGCRSEEWNRRFSELLEDYVMSRVEVAIFDIKPANSGMVRFPKPREKALLEHAGVFDKKSDELSKKVCTSKKMSEAFAVALA